MTPEEIKAKIQQARNQGVPDEVTFKYLNDRGLIPKEKVVMASTPTSAPEVNPVQGFAQGIAKGEVSTVSGLANIGKTILDQTAGRVVNAIAGKGFTPTDTQIVPSLTKGTEINKQLTTPDSTSENIGFATERIAEFLAPSGAINKVKTVATGAIRGVNTISKIARIGTKSAIEGLSAGGQTALQQGEINDNVKTAGIISALFPIAGTVLKNTGVGIQKIGQKIQQSVIKPSIADIKDGFKVDTLQKFNLGGSLEQTLAKTNAKMNDIAVQLKTKLKDSIVPINLNEVYKNTENRLLNDKIGNFGDISSIQKIIGTLKNEIAEVGGQNGLVDLVDANIIKRGAGTKGSWVFGNADPDARAVEKVYNTFYNEIKIAIEKAAEKSGQGGIKELNKQLSELIPVSNAVLRRIPIAERNNAISLTDVISITGSFIDPKALILTGVNKLSKSGQVGSLLTKAGDIIKNPKTKNDVVKRLFGN